MSTTITTHTEPILPALAESSLPAIRALTQALGIPREVLASDEEIIYAWRDLPRELKNIPASLRDELIARMCVAVSTGLFDSAMNYIWNASIIHLRNKIKSFGLHAVSQILQVDFEQRNLDEMQDNKLLELCLKLNLITEEGFYFLDQCRDIRNNFSAAHPTIGKVNDREFTTFLNRCIRFALGDQNSPKGVGINDFIGALKAARFNSGQKDVWVNRIKETHAPQRQLIITLAHGIYCDPKSAEPTRLNALDICATLKPEFTNSLRSELISKHYEYAAKGDEPRGKASLAFFEKLEIVSLLHEAEQHSLFNRAIELMWNIHCGPNNFYNEGPFAERLYSLSKQTPIPETIRDEFVEVVVCCNIGNGWGYCWAASTYFENIIKAFSPREIISVIRLAANDTRLGRRLQAHQSCRTRFKQTLSLINKESVHESIKADYENFLKN